MKAWALFRSLLIYYGPFWRRARQRRFYGQFLSSGDLCFDIGAHVGNRIRIWRSLGARVVALEPQPDCFSLLQRIYGRDPAIQLVEAAAGARPGTLPLQVSPRNLTVSTLSGAFIRAVSRADSFAGVSWEEATPVTVTTLDRLIARHGVPRFCKIDVEGYEDQVLAGLTQPLPLLSVEFVPAAGEVALACIDRLEAMAGYEYNWSWGESHRLAAAAWVPAGETTAMLKRLGPGDPSGDLYARRVPV